MSSQDLSRVTGSTLALAILGYPVHHSLSPVIHNAAFAAAGLDYCYLALEVRPEDIEAAVKGIRAMNFAGFTLTAPHKETVIPFLDELTEDARALGSVNTVVNKNGRWIGTNTDVTGFRRMLEIGGLYRKGMKALMIGAGGAARSALYALSQVASEVVIFNRTVSRAEELTRYLAPFQGSCRWQILQPDRELIEAHLKDADLLVNTTSVGMHPHDNDCPLPEGIRIPASCGVADIIYMPAKTRLLQCAEEGGSKIVSGHDMLLYQGVDAFTFWTGIEPDVEVMDRALRSASGR